MATDPFEKAAWRERRAELRQEARKAAIAEGPTESGRRYWRRGSERSGGALRFFLFPWVLWGLLRAPAHPWDATPLPEAFIEFFFGSLAFGLMTGWVLFLFWVWFIGSSDD